MIIKKNFFNKNKYFLDDDEYQVQYEDEEDDERTIEEEEQFGSDDEQDELDDLEAVKNILLFKLHIYLFIYLGCKYAFGRITQIIWSKCSTCQ